MYWVLADVPSELRSQLTSIYLALLCKANDVKKYGYARVLEPFLKDLTTLEKEGIFFLQVGRNIRGIVVCVTADNLSAHSLSGLVESFSGYYISTGFVSGTILTISRRKCVQELFHQEQKRFTCSDC